MVSPAYREKSGRGEQLWRRLQRDTSTLLALGAVPHVRTWKNSPPESGTTEASRALHPRDEVLKMEG